MSPDIDALASLTRKQRDVLDLLVEFKTSKDIARILNISPHTVDQRVELAKSKLGAGTRAELAVIYRNLVGQGAPISERMTYEGSDLVVEAEAVQFPGRVGSTAIAPPGDPEPSNSVVPDGDRDLRVVPEVLDGRWGTLARLATILGITILLSVAFLGGLTIFVEVSHLVAG